MLDHPSVGGKDIVLHKRIAIVTPVETFDGRLYLFLTF